MTIVKLKVNSFSSNLIVFHFVITDYLEDKGNDIFVYKQTFFHLNLSCFNVKTPSLLSLIIF